MKKVNSIGLALLWIALVGAVPLAAQSQQPKPLVISAINKTADSDKAAGHERKAGALARPGDVLGYSLAFTNRTSGHVSQVQFVDPLPTGLVYQTGSARADKAVRIEYSIDGGKSWSVEPMVIVLENGRRVSKPAPREEQCRQDQVDDERLALSRHHEQREHPGPDEVKRAPLSSVGEQDQPGDHLWQEDECEHRIR